MANVDLDIKLSENFTLREMCRSWTAEQHHIDNKPDSYIIFNLKRLCREVLQPVRDKWGKTMRINSGYRSAALNKEVGGVPTSFHVTGRAADIHVSGDTEGRALAALLLAQKSTDLVLLEKKRGNYWVHVQISDSPRHKYGEKKVY